jgi:PAS domain S-box-containing protein
MKDEVASSLYERIVAQMPEAVIFADRDGLIRLWNRGAEVVFGYAAAEVVGKSLDIIIPDDLREKHWDGYRQAVSAGRTRLGDRALPTKAVRKEGQKIYVELSFAVIRSEAGAVIGALAVGRNITEKYAQDKALQRRLAELEKANAARSQHSKSGDGPE